MPLRARIALLGAAGGVGGLLLVHYAAFHIGFLERADQSVLRGFVDLGVHPHVTTLAGRIAGLCNPKPYLVIALAIVLVAVIRRRAWLVVGAGMLLLGAPATTELLKPALATPRPPSSVFTESPVAPWSWPSGHATASMAIALAVALVAPTRWRPWAATLGAGFAAAVCFSFMTLQWHLPSDVLAGFLVAAVWTSLAVAVVSLAERNRPAAAPSPGDGREPWHLALAPAGAALLGALLLGGLLALARPHAFVHYAAVHRSFVVGAGAIGLLALSLVTGLSLLTRR